jgi:hypothetical protein
MIVEVYDGASNLLLYSYNTETEEETNTPQPNEQRAVAAALEEARSHLEPNVGATVSPDK